jgi:hypothetical protein
VVLGQSRCDVRKPGCGRLRCSGTSSSGQGVSSQRPLDFVPSAGNACLMYSVVCLRVEGVTQRSSAYVPPGPSGCSLPDALNVGKASLPMARSF